MPFEPKRNPFGDDAAQAEPDVASRLSAAHQEALRVHDSPVRADQLADRLPALARAVAGSDLIEEYRDRIRAHLADAERVLRRDDDGREAAKHLDAALRLAERKPRNPSPSSLLPCPHRPVACLVRCFFLSFFS